MVFWYIADPSLEYRTVTFGCSIPGLGTQELLAIGQTKDSTFKWRPQSKSFWGALT